MYRNRSDAIDSPACTPGSAAGLDSLELEGHGRGKRPVSFRMMARHTTVHRPVGPLRAKFESTGSGDFSPLWAGQAASLARALPARTLTRMLAAETQQQLDAIVARYASNRG